MLTTESRPECRIELPDVALPASVDRQILSMQQVVHFSLAEQLSQEELVDMYADQAISYLYTYFRLCCVRPFEEEYSPVAVLRRFWKDVVASGVIASLPGHTIGSTLDAVYKRVEERAKKPDFLEKECDMVILRDPAVIAQYHDARLAGPEAEKSFLDALPKAREVLAEAA